MKLVVVGDSLLDVDIEGAADRVCPDAPAPVPDVSAGRARSGVRRRPPPTAWT